MKMVSNEVLLYITCLVVFAPTKQCNISQPVLELSNCISTLKNLNCKVELPWLQNCTQDYTLVMFYKHTDYGRKDPTVETMKKSRRVKQKSQSIISSSYWECSISKGYIIHHYSHLSMMLQIVNSSNETIQVSNILTFNASSIEKGPSFRIYGINSTSDSLGIDLKIDDEDCESFCEKHSNGVKILVSLSSVQYPDFKKKINYTGWSKAHCKADCQNFFFWITNNATLKLYGGTTYHVKIYLLYIIEGHLEGEQYLSETREMNITTKEAAPSAVPSVTATSYELISRNKTYVQARMFWQQIRREDTNGGLICTRIRAFQVNLAKDIPNSELLKCGDCQLTHVEMVTIEDTHMIHKTVGPSESSATISLHKGNLYKVFIDSINSEGCANDLFISNQVEPIRINTQENHPEISRVAVEANSNEVLVTWMPVNNAVNYTLYWCSSPSGRSRCQEDIQWRNLPETSTEYYLPLGKPEVFSFAVSAVVEKQGLPAYVPMTFASCVYQSNQVLQVPKDLKLTPKKNNELLVTWTNPVCSESRLIGSYQLLYCVLKDKDCTSASVVQQVEVKDGSHQQEIIENILPGKNYQVWLSVIAHDGNITKESKPQTVEAPEPGKYSKHLLYILPLAILALFLVVAVSLFWRYQKPCRAYLKGPRIAYPDPSSNGQALAPVPLVEYHRAPSNNAQDQQKEILFAKVQTDS